MRKLRTQLSLSIVAVVLLTVAVISILANLLINREFENYVIQQQQIRAEDLAANLTSHFDARTQTWDVEFVHGLGMYALYDGYVLSVFDPNGASVWDAENHEMAICAQIMGEIAERMEKRRPRLDGAFVSREYDLDLNGQKIGSMVIRFYGPYFLSDSDLRFLDTLNILLAVVAVLSTLLSVAIGGVLARRIARPIAKTVYIASQIADGKYDIRFEGKTKSKELDELAAAINALSAGLVEQENLRKRLTVDVAHELRTPLTTLSSHLEAMVEGVWEPTTPRLQSCYEEVGRLNNLVSDLERLAKAEGDSLVLHKKDLDLLDAARTGLDQFELEAKKKNISLAVSGETSVVRADRDRLNQVMANLLSNAVKFTPEGGNIRIAVQDTPESGVVIVEDDGIGIPEQELTLIFERFYRTDQSRNRKTGGAGIGLAIVKSIVTAHGGTVVAQRREEGGSRFIVTLPK